MKKARNKRQAHYTRPAMRDWQGGETPMPVEKNCSKAADWVSDILAGLKIADGVEEGRIREGWKAVAGEFVAAQTEVISLKRGVLIPASAATGDAISSRAISRRAAAQSSSGDWEKCGKGS